MNPITIFVGMHDPHAPGALVLDVAGENGCKVVVDPILSKHLRAHQRSGIDFLYTSLVLGGGGILADSMGLVSSSQLKFSALRERPSKRSV